MPKLQLSRTYCYQGKDYGPGLVDIPDSIPSTDGQGKEVTLNPFAEIQAKEKQFQAYLKAGGQEPAPITPSLMGNNSSPPENQTALPPAPNPVVVPQDVKPAPITPPASASIESTEPVTADDAAKKKPKA